MDEASYSDEGALNLSSAIWFSWGVLLNSGIGESESNFTFYAIQIKILIELKT